MNGMTFVNTPGYYYSIAYFLAAYQLESQFLITPTLKP